MGMKSLSFGNLGVKNTHNGFLGNTVSDMSARVSFDFLDHAVWWQLVYFPILSRFGLVKLRFLTPISQLIFNFQRF